MLTYIGLIPRFIPVKSHELVVIVLQTLVFPRHEMRQSLKGAAQIRGGHVFTARGDLCSPVLHFIVLNHAGETLVDNLING